MKWIFITGTLLGGLSVIIAATLRHAGIVENNDVLETALKYHQLYSILIVCVAMNENFLCQRYAFWACILFMAGTLIFSGSLYALGMTEIDRLGMLTPFGGGLLILGWIMLALSAIFNGKRK